MKVLRHTNNWTIDKILLSLPRNLTHHRETDLKDHIASRFHLLARQHGSSALWLTETGILVTHNEAEAQLDYPYEDWLQSAIQSTIEEELTEKQ